MEKKLPILVTSKKADRQLDRLIEDLEDNYSEEYADKFLQNFHSTLELIRNDPMLFPAADESDKNVRKGFAHKYISFYYRITKDTIRILYFINNRGSGRRRW